MARAIGETPARVALAWVIGQPGVASALMGVSRPSQVDDNAGSLSISLPAELRSALDAASAGTGGFLYALFEPPTRNQIIFGGADVSEFR